MSRWLLGLVLASVAFGAIAQSAPNEEPSDAGSAAVIEDALKAGTDAVAAEGAKTAMLPQPNQVILEDQATKQKYLDAMQGFYDYRKDGFEFRSRVFEWQLFSSRVIFVVVILLVLAGIYFAAVQFHVALATAKSLPEQKVEISAKGIIVNSSVLGVVILCLSLAFFYLYLVHIYPIRDVL